VPNGEEGARSFLLRALPEGSPDDPVATWRGYVVPLPSGRQRWFERLDQIPRIVAELLEGDVPDEEHAL
jgi:hypothetical protein